MENLIENAPENTGKYQNPNLFKKGQSGNPNGRPPGVKNFTTKVREALEKIAEGREYTYEEAFIKAILKKAIIDQDSQIIRLIWNYLDGMPIQKFSGEEGSPLQIIIKRANENADKGDTTSQVSG